MLGKLAVLICVAFVALWASQVIALPANEVYSGIPDSDAKRYLFVNEKTEERWFFLATTPVGTDLSTSPKHPILTLVSDGIGKCHGNGSYTISTGTGTMNITVSNGQGKAAPKAWYVYDCNDGVLSDRFPLKLELNGRSSFILNMSRCKEGDSTKLIASNFTRPIVDGLYYPATCNIWIVVKGLLADPLSFPPKSMPANTGLYAREVDIHPHKSFGWSTDGKRKIDVWNTEYGIYTYFKGTGRPLPTIQIDVDTCPTHYLVFFFEFNDRCMFSVELYDDHYDIAINGSVVKEPFGSTANTKIYRFYGNAHGTFITFTSNGAVVIQPDPFQFEYLGTCDLGPDFLKRDHFELQAFTDKRYQQRNCVKPGFKLVDDAPILRPPKKPRRTSTISDEYAKKPRKSLKKKKKPKMYRFFFHDVNRPTLVASVIVCGAFLSFNIIGNIMFMVWRYVRYRRRMQPIGPNAIRD